MLKPVLAAQYIQLFDNNFNAGDDGRLADLVLSRGLNVTVRWEALPLELRDASGAVVASPDLFEGATQVFVAEDAEDALFYGTVGEGARGRVALLHAQFECVAAPTTLQDALHRVFVSTGRLDDSRSCSVRCAPGFFRTHNLRGARCQPHWNPVCGAREFRVAGTSENNAYCRACSGCAGKQLVRDCHATADDVCADCSGDGGPGRVWTNAHGEDCLPGCVPGLVLNQRTQGCEACTHRCPAGFSFPLLAAERDNCTHCVACERRGVQLPRGAVWDFVEDRIDCVATCPTGSAFVSLPGALECVEMLPADRRELAPAQPPVSTRCASPGSADADTCALPGCRLHEGVCTSCFELPEDVRRGTLNEEAHELLPGRGIMNADDALKLRWQFTAACAWTCISDWAPVQSADKTYWKCERREVVESILVRSRWTVDAADNHQNLEWVKTEVSGQPDGAAQSERMLRMLVVLSCVGAPFVMFLCVLCLNITRACFREGPGVQA